MATRHDPRTIALHWATAGLVVLLWLSAQFIDYFPRGPSRWNVVGAHMALGVLLLLLTICRIGWRLSDRSSSLPLPAGQGRAARLVHVALYALVLTSLALGLWNAWTRGEHVFNLFQIPAFDEGNKALRKWAGSQHKLLVNVLLFVAGAHALVGLAHHFIRRDGVLQRMLPARFSISRKARKP
ncbi:cytochrome b [Roseateles sp. BYS78W]|uniref:Cytochrome b n=1 Tax=Pelomonas candidula TaxID=3299025 RepID=A0ABW7HJG6_9BURK